MRDWLTYRLSDFLLFSARTYYRMFELYHREIWPAQIVALAAVVMIVVVLVRPIKHRDKVVAVTLGVAWLWAGVMFHMRRYASINWAATYFGALFVVQAILLLVAPITRPRSDLDVSPGRRAAVAFLAAVVLPAIVGVVTERTWRQVEVFGLTPDATAIATVALLAFAAERRSFLLVAPLMWCVIGGATLWALDSGEAWLSIIAAIVAVASLIRRRRHAV